MRYHEIVESVSTRFYHGTSTVYLSDILKHGLRAQTSRDWGHKNDGPSRVGVYLTNDYHVATDYAALACDRASRGGRDGGGIAVLVINSGALDAARLHPDDYDLQDRIEDGEAPGITRWQDATWEQSLNICNQVFYDGSIPSTAISVLKTPTWK